MRAISTVNEGATRIGKWTLAFPLDQFTRREKVPCKCDCGTERLVEAGALKRGRSSQCRSCTNRQRDYSTRKRPATQEHGHNKRRCPTGTYHSWAGMKKRCLNSKSQAWDDYGGRGITVCGRWLKFSNFLEDMGERPDGLSLDRINVNGNYEPGNCRWADSITQANNRRIRRAIIAVTFDGTGYSYEQLEKRFKTDRRLIADRLGRGWDIVAALGGEQFLKAA